MVIQLPTPNNSRPETLVVTYEDGKELRVPYFDYKTALSFLSSDKKITGYRLEHYKGAVIK